ncbi:MAG: FAD-dependent oxidoreductase [Ruminococcaceae bacterium]|nr:FAD-dependent oxidoreductase [Oscillospiraceae bacterium]
MRKVTFQKELVEKRHYDLIVCGGGVAGVAAAVTAANRGRSVLLIEKSNILGGLATLGRINLFVPMCNGRGKQIIFGLCEKWTRMSAKYGYDTIPAEWRDGEPKTYTEKRYTQRFSPYIFAFQLNEEIKASGADILLDCMACDPVMEGNVCRGVITESKSGMELYGCEMLIDATGDCDVLRRAGVPTVAGQNFYTYGVTAISLDSMRTALETGDIRKAYTGISGGSINLFGDNQPADVPRWSGLTAEEVTDYLLTMQQNVLDKLKKTDRRSRDVAVMPMMPQFRTTAHIVGDYSLKVADAYRHFDDAVCAINDFEHRDHLFEVPLRTLCRRDHPNLMAVGRGADGTGYGWDLLRVIPPAILTGQAAAHAACHAIEEKTAVVAVDIKRLQTVLEKDNMMVHFPDAYLPEDRTVVIHGKNAAEIEGGHL